MMTKFNAPKKSASIKIDDIEDIQDVRWFLTSIIIGDGLGTIFHPESPFCDYISFENSVPHDMALLETLESIGLIKVQDVREELIRIYSDEECACLEEVMEKCFEICDAISEDCIYILTDEIWSACGLQDESCLIDEQSLEDEERLAEIAKTKDDDCSPIIECDRKSTCPGAPDIDLNDRMSIINYLVWNDRHGTYTDADSALEDKPALTIEQARWIYNEMRILEGETPIDVVKYPIAEL